MRFLKCFVILADLLISPCSFVILVDLLIPIFFKSHTSVLALLTSISAKHYTPSPKIIPSVLSLITLQGDISNALPYSDWSDSERVLLSLAGQYEILRNRLKFPWGENAHNITGSCSFLHWNKTINSVNAAKQNFQISSPCTVLKLSHLEGQYYYEIVK